MKLYYYFTPALTENKSLAQRGFLHSATLCPGQRESVKIGRGW